MGFHATNLALHVACCVALVALVGSLVGGGWTPLCAGLLFALAPVHAEPIAWITGRVDLLATLFFLLAFDAWVRHSRDGRPRDRWLALLWFALGLLSKETVAVLPLVVLGWEALRAPGSGLRAFASALARKAKDALPFLALLGLYAAMRFATFESAARENRLGVRRIVNFVERQQYYLAQLMLPLPPLPGEAASPLAIALASVVCAVLLVAGVALVKRRGREWREVAFFGLAFYAITILPLFMTYRSARHLYMPSIGFAVAAACLLLPPRERATPWRCGAALALVACFGLGLRSAERRWVEAGDHSRRLRQDAERLTRDLPAGAVVLLEEVPRLQAGVLGWDFALPYALQPPFVARDVTAAVRLVEEPGVYCCPVHDWWDDRRPIVSELAGGTAASDVFVLDWNRRQERLERYDAHLAPGALREVAAAALAGPGDASREIDLEEGTRLVRELGRRVRAGASGPPTLAP